MSLPSGTAGENIKYNTDRHIIAAFVQDAGEGAAMYGMSGFGMYGMDILVGTDEAKKALQLIESMNNS